MTFIYVILVIGVTIIITLYISYYIDGEFRFHFYILVIIGFMISMLGLLISGNWLILIISWEGLGMTSFVLINYYQAWERYGNALATVLTIRLGDFIWFIILSYLFWNNRRMILYPLTNNLVIGIICFMAFTKRAQLPFSGWLPRAIRAPTPTSALVHSSTLVTAGLVLLIHWNVSSKRRLLLNIITWLGLFTMLFGSLFAMLEVSIKKLVAYRTLSQIGLGILVYGVGQYRLGFYHLVAHGIAKCLLFIQVGYLIHLSWIQQNAKTWIGVGQVEGSLQVQIGLSLFSLSGICFISGIVRKELILERYGATNWYILMYLIVMVTVYLTCLYSLVIYKLLFNSQTQPVIRVHNSLRILVCTFIQIMLVILFFRFFIINRVGISTIFNYIEVLLPLLVFLTILCFYNGVLFNNTYSGFLSYLAHLVIRNSHYKWSNILLISLKLLENFIYSFIFIINFIINKLRLKSINFNLGFRESLLMLILLLLLFLL